MTNRKCPVLFDRSIQKKVGTLFLRLFFLALSLLVLVKIVDFRLVFRYIQSIPSFVLVFLVVLALVHTWLSSMRWRLVNPDASGQLTGWQYFRLMMMAKPFNLVMPGALGGDFVKAALTLKTLTSNRVNNLIAIMVDRFIGFFSIIVLGSTAMLFMSDIPDRRAIYGLFGLLIGGYGTILLAVGNPWLLRLLESFLPRLGVLGKQLVRVLETWRLALQFFRQNRHRLLLALLLCLPIHGLSFVTTYVLALSLGINVSFFDVSLIMALVWVITSIPLTISGAGVRELSFVYFLSLYGVGPEPATALSVYIYIVTVVKPASDAPGEGHAKIPSQEAH
jgi:uncharacterized protein (TIRG00374 family)